MGCSGSKNNKKDIHNTSLSPPASKSPSPSPSKSSPVHNSNSPVSNSNSPVPNSERNDRNDSLKIESFSDNKLLFKILTKIIQEKNTHEKLLKIQIINVNYLPFFSFLLLLFILFFFVVVRLFKVIIKYHLK